MLSNTARSGPGILEFIFLEMIKKAKAPRPNRSVGMLISPRCCSVWRTLSSSRASDRPSMPIRFFTWLTIMTMAAAEV